MFNPKASIKGKRKDVEDENLQGEDKARRSKDDQLYGWVLLEEKGWGR